MSLPHVLTSLSPREAITDAVYRAVQAFDDNDVAIFNSAFINDEATFDLNGHVFENLEAVRTQLLSLVGPMDTLHQLSNIRIEIEDSTSTARLTCYAVAQHCPPGKGNEPDGPKLIAGSRYNVDLVKDKSDGAWKIKKFAMKLIWRAGDLSVMERPSS
jgi:hypothetical protein